MREIDIWRPFDSDIVSPRDAFDRMLEDSFIFPERMMTRMRYPKIDIQETDNKVEVKAEVPGINEEDVNVEVSDNTLTISGERKEEKEEKGEEGYYRRESFRGTFRRTVALPTDVAGDKAEATYDNGVLTVSLPKTETKASTKINIKKRQE